MKHNFPIQELSRQVSIPHTEARLIEDIHGYVLHLSSRYALGNQVTTSTSKSDSQFKFIKVPASLVEHLKYVLTQWQPTLKFGWLVPNYETISIPQSVTYSTNNYYNVYPISTEKRINSLELLETPLNPLTWLKGMPATNEDIAEARDYLNREECAKAMAVTREFR